MYDQCFFLMPVYLFNYKGDNQYNFMKSLLDYSSIHG